MIIQEKFSYNHLALLLLISCFLACCAKSNEAQSHELNTEIQKWKRQLILNGEVGNPCLENVDKWVEHNPERFYGLPKEAIKVKTFDANNDKIMDVLLYFPAGDCCSCSVGVNEASDYLKLIYSDGSYFLSNDNLREKISQKIESEYVAQTNTDVERAIFSVSGFSMVISGSYKLWTLEAPDCCANVEGTFEYNPFTFKLKITFRNVN